MTSVEGATRPVVAVAIAGTVRITDACTACGACLATCPERALRRARRRPAVVDELCTACWECVDTCPAGAIFEVGR
jgi:Fe-S-cluster-containing hydrogenase component 2